MLSPELLTILRTWYRAGQVERKMLPGGWLFPGQQTVNPLSTRQLRRAFHRARDAAGVTKKVSLHTLRHAFATHLLEQHEDIRVIQVLFGHRKLESTARYSHVAANRLREVKGKQRFKTMTLTANEFLRHFLIHISPLRFHRIRHFSLFANHQRKRNLVSLQKILCTQTLGTVDKQTDSDEASKNSMLTFHCRVCGNPMIIIETLLQYCPTRGPP